MPLSAYVRATTPARAARTPRRKENSRFTTDALLVSFSRYAADAARPILRVIRIARRRWNPRVARAEIGMLCVKGGSALSEGKKILCPFDGVLEAAKELLQIGVAIDEINVRSIDDQQIGSRVAEEKVFVGAHDRFKVFG